MKKVMISVMLIFMWLLCHAQATWNVKLTSPGNFEINITPTQTIEMVKCNITISKLANQKKTFDVNFTNLEVYTLKPGKTYAKSFTCDVAYTNATGNYLALVIWSASGANADDRKVATRVNVQSGSVLKQNGKTIIKDLIDTEKKYTINQVESHKCLTVNGGPNESRAAIDQMPRLGYPTQVWQFKALSDDDFGYYTIHPYANRNMCLTVSNPNNTDAQIVQFQCNGTNNQKWKIILLQGGKLIVQSKFGDKVLTSFGLINQDHAPITITSRHNQPNQQWLIIEQ